MHSFVLIEFFQSCFDFLFGHFRVARDGFYEPLEVEILDFLGVTINNFFHVLTFLFAYEYYLLSIIDAICGGVKWFFDAKCGVFSTI